MPETPLVAPEWLADHRNEPSVHVIDVREPWEYESIGHLPGAVNIPFDSYRDAASSDPGTLPGADTFGKCLGEAGIESGDTIVAYDDTHGVFAARLLVTALAYGHENVALLNGDFSSWQRTFETTTASPTIDPVSYPIEGLAASAPIVDRAAVEAAIADDTVRLLDTRDEAEYAEQHIPGAIRIDWRAFVDDDTRGVKPAAELESLLTDRGLNAARDQRIILYCNTSRRLSHTFVVLRSLGFTDVAIYEGSMADWTAAGGATESIV